MSFNTFKSFTCISLLQIISSTCKTLLHVILFLTFKSLLITISDTFKLFVIVHESFILQSLLIITLSKILLELIYNESIKQLFLISMSFNTFRLFPIIVLDVTYRSSQLNCL